MANVVSSSTRVRVATPPSTDRLLVSLMFGQRPFFDMVVRHPVVVCILLNLFFPRSPETTVVKACPVITPARISRTGLGRLSRTRQTPRRRAWLPRLTSQRHPRLRTRRNTAGTVRPDSHLGIHEVVFGVCELKGLSWTCWPFPTRVFVCLCVCVCVCDRLSTLEPGLASGRWPVPPSLPETHKDIAFGQKSEKLAGVSALFAAKPTSQLGQYVTDRAERMYESVRKEPVGKAPTVLSQPPAYTRDPSFPGFGRKSGTSASSYLTYTLTCLQRRSILVVLHALSMIVDGLLHKNPLWSFVCLCM
jgi:hypothetical protein